MFYVSMTTLTCMHADLNDSVKVFVFESVSLLFVNKHFTYVAVLCVCMCMNVCWTPVCSNVCGGMFDSLSW